MPTVKLHVEKYENMIDRRGRFVKWQEAVICSCWNLDSGQPSYACLVCRGRGYTYGSPLIQKALVMSITMNKDYEEMSGVFEVGDAVMTVPRRLATKNPATGIYDNTTWLDNPMFQIGMHDLITLTDDDYKSSEILVRNEPIYGRPADELINEDITTIVTVRKSNPLTGALTSYAQGADFTLDGNKIAWTSTGNRPADGEQYSVVYRHRPVYTVLTTLPKPRHQDNQDLPRYVVLRYRHGGFDKQ